MPICTKEQVSQHAEARMCSAKESDVSFFGNIKFKLNNYIFSNGVARIVGCSFWLSGVYPMACWIVRLRMDRNSLINLARLRLKDVAGVGLHDARRRLIYPKSRSSDKATSGSPVTGCCTAVMSLKIIRSSSRI